jgi:hypothetical protein
MVFQFFARIETPSPDEDWIKTDPDFNEKNCIPFSADLIIFKLIFT